MAEKSLEEQWTEYKEKGICPVCGYAGRNTLDLISGYPAGLNHNDYAIQHIRITCKIALLEEKKTLIPDE